MCLKMLFMWLVCVLVTDCATGNSTAHVTLIIFLVLVTSVAVPFDVAKSISSVSGSSPSMSVSELRKAVNNLHDMFQVYHLGVDINVNVSNSISIILDNPGVTIRVSISRVLILQTLVSIIDYLF